MTTKRQYTRDTLLEVKIHVEESRRFSIRVPANADFLASSNPVQALAGGGVRSSHGRRRDGGPATAAFRDAPGHRDRRERRAVNPPADHQHSDDEQQISGDSPSEAVGVRANRGPENAWPRAPKPVDANGAVVSSPAPPSGNLSPATTTTAAAAGGDGGSSAPQAMWCYRFKGSSTESAAMKWSDVAGLVDSGVFDATSVEVRRITPAETDWTLFTDAQFALEKKSGAVVAEHTAPAPTSAAAPTVNSTGKQPAARPNGTSTSEAATPAAADGGKPSEAPKPKPNAWATGGKSFLAVVAPERVVSSSSQPASPSAPATVAMNAPTAERQAPQLSAIEQALTRVKSDTEIGGASSPSKAPSQKVPEHASVPVSTSSTSSKTVPKPDTAAPAKVAPIPADIASPAVAQPPPRTSANSAPSAVVKPQTNPPAPEQPATNAVDAPKVEPKVAPPAAVGEPKPAPAVAPTAVVPAPTVASVAQDTPTVRPTAAAPSKKEARSAKTPSAPTSVDDKPAQQAAPAAPTVATAPPAPPAKPAWGKVATAVPAAVDFEKVLQEELTTPSIIAAPQSHWVAVAASPAVANTSSAINPNQESSTHDAKGAKHHQQQPVPATPGKAPAGPPLPRSKHDAAGQATSPTTSAPTPTPAPAAAPPLPKSKQLHHDPAIVSVSHTAPVSAPVVDHASTVPPPAVPERGHVRNNIPAPKSKLASSGGSSDSSPTSPAQVPPPPYSEAPQQQQQQQPTPFAPAPAPRSKWLAKREQRKLLQGQNVVNSVPPAEPTAPLPVSIPVDAVPTTKPTFAQRRQERAERKLAEQQSLTTAAPPPQPVVVPSVPNQDQGLKRSSKTAVKRDSAVVAVEAPPVSPPFFVVMGDAAKTAPVDAEDTEASVTKRDRKRQQWQERMQGQKAARAAKRAQRDEEPFHAAEEAALPSPTPPSYGATNKVTAPTEDWGAVDDASAGATGGGKKKEKWTWKEKKQQIKERKAAAAAATAVSSPLPPPPPPGPQPSTSQSHEVVSKRKARQAVQQQPATDAPVEEDAATPSRRGEGKKQQLPKKSSAKTSKQPPASLVPPPSSQAPSAAVVQSSDVEPSAAKPKVKRANKIKPSASVPEPFETPSFVVAEASGKPKRQQQPLKAPQPQRKQELPPPPPPAPLATPQHVDAAGGATRKRRVKAAVENATLPLSAPPAVAVALPRSQRKQRASHTDATAGNVNFLPPPPPPEYNAPPPAYVEGPSGAHETVGAGRGRKPFRPFARRARGGVY